MLPGFVSAFTFFQFEDSCQFQYPLLLRICWKKFRQLGKKLRKVFIARQNETTDFGTTDKSLPPRYPELIMTTLLIGIAALKTRNIPENTLRAVCAVADSYVTLRGILEQGNLKSSLDLTYLVFELFTKFNSLLNTTVLQDWFQKGTQRALSQRSFPNCIVIFPFWEGYFLANILYVRTHVKRESCASNHPPTTCLITVN